MVAPDFDLGADAYRRRIRLATAPDGTVTSILEDDFHHFVVTLAHDGERVTGVECRAVRWPWSTCPDAAEPLRRLEGMPLTDRFTGAGAWTDPKQCCTHQFDAAGHAITHAATGRVTRVYDIELPRRDPDTGETRARLWVDGEPALEWTVTWAGIVDPAPELAAAPWKGGFMRWADAHLPPDAAERPIALRRACDIGMGRGMDLDGIPEARLLPPSMSGVCHTMQPLVIGNASRHVGSIRDFATRPDDLAPPA
ncbi:MAG: hypothetical protein ACKOOG_05190 [Actinomycetota bacterium]